jgi:hypothetical protein
VSAQTDLNHTMAYIHFVLEEAEEPKELCTSLKLGDSPANLLINQWGYGHTTRALPGVSLPSGLEPGTSRFSTLRLNHYAARGIPLHDSIMMIIATRRAHVYLDMYTLERLSGSASLLIGTHHWATVSP